MGEINNLLDEDKIVAQLEHMGVDYLNHSTGETFSETISPVELIIIS